MSAYILLGNSRTYPTRVPLPDAPPPATTFNGLVSELPNVSHYWPIDGNVGDGLSPLIGTVPLSIVTGFPIVGQPSIVENDDNGTSIFFDDFSGQPVRLAAAHDPAWNIAAYTIFLHAVVMDVSQKTTLLARGTSQNGLIVIESETNGRPRFAYKDDTGTVINLRGDEGDFITGRSFAMALAVGGGEIRGFYKNAGGSVVKLSSAATIVTPVFTSAFSIGGYFEEAATLTGIESRIIFCSSALTDEQIATVLLPKNVVSANAFAAGSVVTQTSSDYDVLSRAVYLGSKEDASITFTQPSGGSTFQKLSSGLIRINAGSTTGPTSGTYSVQGSSQAPIDFNVVEDVDPGEETLPAYEGLAAWGASAGNAWRVGQQAKRSVITWRAERTGTINEIQFDINWHRYPQPGKELNHYWRGDGGDMQVTIRSNSTAGGDNLPNLTSGGILWQSPVYKGIQQPPQDTRVEAGKIRIPVGPLSVTRGTIYHFEWRNLHSNPTANCYSVNACYNESIPIPRHPMYGWDVFHVRCNPLGDTSSDNFQPLTHRDVRRWIPLLWIFYNDGIVAGQGTNDAGTTSNVMTPEGGGSIQGNTREIVLSAGWQARQRLTRDRPNLTVDRVRMRVWRRTSSTDGNLRFRIEREESGGGVTTLATVLIPASAMPNIPYDNQENGLVFPGLDYALGANVTLELGKTYRFRLDATGSARYAIRAPNAGNRTALNITWSGPTGRAEYSTDGGSTWIGWQMYGSIDRPNNHLNLLVYNSAE